MTTYNSPTSQNRESGFWPWLFQRVSGLLLIGLVAIHIWMAHFSGLPEVIRGTQEDLVLYEIVKQRLAQGLFIAVDFSLLALVIYHGLNGIRNILMEWRPASQRPQLLNTGLLLLGIITFAYGSWALLGFIL